MPNKNFNDAGIDYVLFTPGPVQVPDWILAEMGKANDTHRAVAYQQMNKAIKEGMQKLLNTKNDIFLWANSATGVMDACVINLLGENDNGLFFSCGDFGDRWEKMAKAWGKKHEFVQVDPGQAITPELVQSSLAKGKYTVVFITMNETATGVMNPIDKIGPLVKAHGALLCVDCVSCMAGVKIDVDAWGIDVALASVQKCFSVPPGLAVSSVSSAALEKAKTVKNRGVYLDFLELKKSDEKNEHPVTPPIPQIRALKKSLEKILEKSPEKHYAEQAERTQMIRNWAIGMGFKILGPEPYQSKTVVTIENTLGIDTPKFVSGLFEKGYKIVNGYGKLVDKTFRMAAMGWISKEETQKMLNAATEVVKSLKK